MQTNLKKYQKEFGILKNYLIKKNFKITKQRQFILEIFLSLEGHVSAEELYIHVNKKDSSIGLATVYRAMNLFSKCGLAQSRQFGDNQTRYEHGFNHAHHDHLICDNCGEIKEFENKNIEHLQKKVAEENNFLIYSHKLEIHGLCKKCNPKKK